MYFTLPMIEGDVDMLSTGPGQPNTVVAAWKAQRENPFKCYKHSWPKHCTERS